MNIREASERRVVPRTGDEVIRGCLRGEEGAWRAFLGQFGPLITTVATRAGAKPSDVEEIFQSAVLAIYERLGTLREPDRIVPWIATIARRTTIRYLAGRSRETSGSAKLSDRIDEAPLAEDEIALLQRDQLLWESLADLGPRCRTILEGLYVMEPPVSYERLAEHLEIPLGSVGPTRARCLQTLRALLVSRESSRRKKGGS
jgi:RNA polymerase sigma factor (sigma-70 family)